MSLIYRERTSTLTLRNGDKGRRKALRLNIDTWKIENSEKENRTCTPTFCNQLCFRGCLTLPPFFCTKKWDKEDWRPKRNKNHGEKETLKNGKRNRSGIYDCLLELYLYCLKPLGLPTVSPSGNTLSKVKITVGLGG